MRLQALLYAIWRHLDWTRMQNVCVCVCLIGFLDCVESFNELMRSACKLRQEAPRVDYKFEPTRARPLLEH